MEDGVKKAPIMLPPKGTRWSPDDWENIKRAAKIRDVAVSEIIRTGTLRFVRRVLAKAA